MGHFDRQNFLIIQSAIFNIQLKCGADERIWTADLLITNQLLYQLSYVGLKSIRQLLEYVI